MTDAFVAEVIRPGANNTWTVAPQIIEHDGTDHPNIDVGIVEGITPTVGDMVLVLTTRNTLDNAPIQRYFTASEACGRIVAILETGEYKFTGNYKFIGDFTIDGNLTVTGNLTVNGDATMDGEVTIKGKLTAENDVQIDGDLTADGSVTITNDATINGRSFMTHVHLGPLPPSGPTGAVQ